MEKLSLNQGWKFRKLPGLTISDIPAQLPEGEWTPVTLPHTWFKEEDPWQGLAVYETTFRRQPGWERAFLSFEGADQQCRVFVNGQEAGSHRGGYSRFRLPVPDAAANDPEWQLTVFLENSTNEDIAPSFGDFTVFGGLSRNVDLLICKASHFDRCYYGTDGLIVRASVNENDQGILTAEPHVISEAGQSLIRYTLTDEQGSILRTIEGNRDETVSLAIDSPLLWDGVGNVHFYSLSADLFADGQQTDHTEIRTGFRRITLDGESGLHLNGRPCPIHGVARHQDRAGKYSAVSDQEIAEDFALIREIGANGVRLSHYQHPQAAYNCCDEMGLLCWAEIPMLKMTESPALMENAVQQLTELILQNIHHPSIFCWGIQNEIAMFRDAPYMHENCRKLHELVHTLDPNRLSTAANLYPLKAKSQMNSITDMVGYNVYFGWYYGEIPDFGPYLDKFHALRPNLPFGISEYGVDANLALHSETPTVKDYSEEYQALWHEKVYPQIEARSWLWGSFVWNMFDFSSSRRNEGGQKFINAKGLVSHDRKICKDAFYYYKARWSQDPFVHLCGSRFVNRAQDKIDVKCYTNQPAVRLEVNGTVFGTCQAENGTALFRDVPLRMGPNQVTASAGSYTDAARWMRVTEPDPSYVLPDQGTGTAVRNWFLTEDNYRKEGFFSIQSTAQELLDNPDTRAILEQTIPELVRVMTERNVIPLGLALKSILGREADESLDINALNDALNRIPDTDQ